ncbi:MAG: hypothetical protein AAF585_18130, partial [Verrucomicrobiota bacterium]
MDLRIALALLIAPAAFAEPNELLRRAHEEIYAGRPWYAVELLAEVLRPSNLPDSDRARQLLDRIEPNSLPPIQRERLEWVRAVVSMQIESDAAYLTRLYGPLLNGEFDGKRYGQIWNTPANSHPRIVELYRVLEQTIIPTVDFEDTRLDVAIESILERAEELGRREESVDFKLILPRRQAGAEFDDPFSLGFDDGGFDEFD